MKSNDLSRRRFMTAAALGGAVAIGRPGLVPAAVISKPKDPFSYCLNMSTIRGQNLSLDREIEIAAEAGYTGIEPWVRKINDYEAGGGNLNDIRKKTADLGLTVEGAIDFSRWIIDDDAERAKGLEQVKRAMDVLARIGGKRIAAPPAGATSEPGLDLMKAAERYHALLELGDQTGVVPQLETWGSSKNLHRLGQAMFVVIESGHPKACLLPDVFHTYKGGTDFQAFKQLSAHTVQVLHMNDYPADPPRETIADRDRVMPGDGIAPIRQILADLIANGSRAVLSLELFSPVYWKQDPLKVARIGLEKMKTAAREALDVS